MCGCAKAAVQALPNISAADRWNSVSLMLLPCSLAQAPVESKVGVVPAQPGLFLRLDSKRCHSAQAQLPLKTLSKVGQSCSVTENQLLLLVPFSSVAPWAPLQHFHWSRPVAQVAPRLGGVCSSPQGVSHLLSELLCVSWVTRRVLAASRGSCPPSCLGEALALCQQRRKVVLHGAVPSSLLVHRASSGHLLQVCSNWEHLQELCPLCAHTVSWG